jgi:membrane-anchored glycerophosphoryl diester phosphodiesterase (GDPDase)
MDIGRVFSTSFAMFRQRFWLLLGMWAVFLVIQIAAFIVLMIGIVAVGLTAGLDSGLQDPAALTGLGAGMIAMIVLLYAAYFVILIAQQAAMVTIASPLEEPVFGAAMVRGFRSALPFFGIGLIMVLAGLVLSFGITAVFGVSVTQSNSAGAVIVAILPLLFLPLLIYLGCRFSVLIPVVAVDQVFNPFTALRRSWSVTRGKVLRILLALIGFIVLSVLVLGVPYAVLFGAAFAGNDFPTASIGLMLFGFLIFVPLLIAYTMFTSAFTAALHCEVTEGGAERLEEVFA